MFWRTNKKKKDPNIRTLCTLQEAELDAYIEQRKLVLEYNRMARMLEYANNAFLSKLKEKYTLPDEFEVDHSTGEVTARMD